MPNAPIRILFNTWANRENTNSQSLTAREIASRLSPERFRSSLFLGWGQEPDPKVGGREEIRLLRVPPRLGSLFIARELLWGSHDIVFYPALNPRASRLFRTGRRLGRKRLVVDGVETSLDQIAACGKEIQQRIFASLRQADLRTAITPAISRDLEQQHQLESEVVPLGVDLSLFQWVDRSHHEPPWKVVYVASIQQRKQTHIMLDLAQRLRSQDVEFHCIGPCLGDPAYCEALFARKARERLDKVTFHGELSQPEIYRHLRQADLYVLPSRLEGFGKTTLEAAASGLPAIVFSDYETTAVVDGETGFQVATEEEMLAAVEELLADPELRHEMGWAASAHAQTFSWDPIARRWETLFSRLAQGEAA